MKKQTKLLLSLAAMLVTTSSLHATNGINLIGEGAKSRAMGGTGVSFNQGAESAFKNPALINQGSKDTQITIGGTILAPDVSFTDNVTGTSKTETSTAGAGIIPAVAVVNKVTDQFAWGVAMYGTGGMGVDYREATTTAQGGMKSNDNLMVMRLSVPLAYKVIEGLSIGIAPILEYGALSMNGGSSSDIAYGYEVGANYTIAGFGFGADYKSEIEHTYKNTFNSNFDKTTGMLTTPEQDKLSSPSVITVGANYTFETAKDQELTLAVDYKIIGYSSSAGLDDFGWEDQSVIAVGAAYKLKGLGVARIGYNYGAQPIDVDGNTNPSGSLGSLMAFPGVTENHATIGGSAKLTDNLCMDVAYVYGWGKADLENGRNPMTGASGYEASAENNQNSVTVALNYGF